MSTKLPIWRSVPKDFEEGRQRLLQIANTGWCQGQMAIDSKGYQTYPRSRAVVACCLYGAIQRVGYLPKSPADYLDFVANVADNLPKHFKGVDAAGRLMSFNDSKRTDQARVVKFIETAKEKHSRKQTRK